MPELVSVVIPAFRAQAILPRAVQSALAQTWTSLEVIVVGDDGSDYARGLRAAGIDDPRIQYVSTGRSGSGCHNARNAGLAAAQGDYIAALDADDVFLPGRLAVLAPLAREHGAATDNPAVISEASGERLCLPLALSPRTRQLSAGDLLALNVPLFPVVRRDHAEPRLAGVEFGEDVVANLRLIDRIGALYAVSDTLSEYRVLTGSLCHGDNSADNFERSYGELIARIETGDGLGLSPALRPVACEGLKRKRALNRAFGQARATDPELDFQTFAARRRAVGA